MTKNSSRRLLIYRAPYADESIEGFVSRLCEANRIPVLRWILNELNGDTSYGPMKCMMDVVTDPDALEKLEDFASLPSGALRDLALELGFAARGRLICTDSFEWPIGAFAFDHQQLCPDCLRDAPYHRKAWRFIHAPVCTRHKRALIDRCPSCEKPILGSRTDICHCHSCKADFREAKGRSVADAVSDFAHLLQHPQMLSFGTSKYTESLTPEDLFLLWRLADLPGPGEPLAMKATYLAGSLPIERRLRALELLASAWQPNRLDGPTLRANLEGRWAHLNVIHTSGLINRQLAAATRRAGLDPELAHVLLNDCPGGTVSAALLAYGPRLPRLLSPLEVAQFLGVSIEVVETSLIGTNLLTLPDEDEGFDVDELYAVQTFLESMLTEDQVDQAVGFKGGATHLENLGLIRRWGSYADRIKCFPENEVIALFDRVSENITAKDSSNITKSLKDCALDDIDNTKVAYLIALAVNSGIEIQGWATPFRLGNRALAPHLLVVLTLVLDA